MMAASVADPDPVGYEIIWMLESGSVLLTSNPDSKKGNFYPTEPVQNVYFYCASIHS
jgi:hypothetical protein